MKPQTRKEKIREKARRKKVEVLGKKIGHFSSIIDNLEKRLKKIEDKE